MKHTLGPRWTTAILLLALVACGGSDDGITDPGVNPTVTIGPITMAGPGGTRVPVDPNNISGAIEVAFTVDPGSQTLDHAVIVINSDTVRAGPLIGGARLPTGAGRSAVEPTVIIASINTAEITDPATGAVRFPNGAKTLRAVLFTRPSGGSSATVAAQVSTDIILRNQSGFLGTITTIGTTTTANDALNNPWARGAISINAIPVLYGNTAAPYTVPTIASTRITFGSAQCGAGGPRTLLVPSSGGQLFTAVFNNSDAAATANNVVGYEFQMARCLGDPGQTNALLFRFGEVPGITAIGSDGNPIALANAGSPAGGAGFLNDPYNPIYGSNGFSIRLDNLGPSTASGDISAISPQGDATPPVNSASYATRICAPAIATPLPPYCHTDGKFVTLDVGDRSNGWLNDAVELATAYVDNESDAPFTAVDFGVSRQIGPGPSRVTFDTRVGGVALTDAQIDALGVIADLGGHPETGAGGLKMRSNARDGLGNTSSKVTSAIGIDRLLPVLTIPFDQLTINAANAGTLPTGLLTGLAIDPGANASGFRVPGGALRVEKEMTTMIAGIRVSYYFCPSVNSYVPENGACQSWFPGSQFYDWVSHTIPFSEIAPLQGYLKVTANVGDQAGNRSLDATATVLYDINPPTVATIQFPAQLTGIGIMPFDIVANDNVGVGSGVLALNYGPRGVFEYPSVTVGTYGSPLQGQANVSVPVPLMTNLQITGTSGNPQSTGQRPIAAGGLVRDVAGNTSTGNVQTIPGTAFSAVTLFPSTFQLLTAAVGTQVSRDGATAGVPQSIILRSDILALSTVQSPFANPFVRVDFWVQTGTGAFKFAGSSTSPTVLDVGGTRTYAYEITWDPNSYSAFVNTGSYQFIAVGVNANGEAVRSQPNPSPISMSP